jgi:hypothetical protein
MVYSSEAGFQLGQLIGFSSLYGHIVGREPHEVLVVCLGASLRALKRAWVTKSQAIDALLGATLAEALGDDSTKNTLVYLLEETAKRTTDLIAQASRAAAPFISEHPTMCLRLTKLASEDREKWRQQVEDNYASDPQKREEMLTLLDQMLP